MKRKDAPEPARPKRDIHYYMSLPYSVRFQEDDEGDVVAWVDELPGCMSHGTGYLDALGHLRETMKLYLTDCLERREAPPLPSGAKAATAPAGGIRTMAEILSDLKAHASRWQSSARHLSESGARGSDAEGVFHHASWLATLVADIESWVNSPKPSLDRLTLVKATRRAK